MPSRWYKWELIAILFLAFFLHQGDRQIYHPLLERIRIDLGASEFQAGLVATIFTVIYGLFVPLAGCLGDFFSKKWIVALSLLVFSLGTLLTGLSQSLLMLIVFRSVATGVGEAFYYPAANSLIGQYHAQTRASAMAIHQTALYVGIVASSWIAPVMADLYSWRVAFCTFGSLGVLATLVVSLRIRNERQDASDGGQQAATDKTPPRLAEVGRAVLSKPTLYFLCLAFAAMVFVNVGFMTWMPTYLFERFHVSASLPSVSFFSMLWHYIFAFVGVTLGGQVSDRLSPRRPTIRMEMEAMGLLLGAPFIFLMGWCSELGWVYVALAAFGLFRGFYDSNLFAALFDVIAPKYRSSATGLMLSFAFVVGSTSPMLLGYLKPKLGLSIGLSSLAIAYVFGSIMILVALRWTFTKDRVREELPESSGFEVLVKK